MAIGCFKGRHPHVMRQLLLVLLLLVCKIDVASCQDRNSAACNNNSEEANYKDDAILLDGSQSITFSRQGLPDRKYFVYTPKSYNRTTSSSAGLVLAFHGWGGSGRSWTMDEETLALAEEYNYVIVAPNGLKGDNEYNSWQNQGSNTGFDPTETKPICDVSQGTPDYCYESCKPCRNRCYWTHCLDDDVQFVRDLIVGSKDSDVFVNALPDRICFDNSKVFVAGSSNGGMFVWTLLQDPRTAELFRAAAPIIGLPHCGYGLPSTDDVPPTPVISITGKYDQTVSPSNLPWPGAPSDKCAVNRDGDRYYYVPSNHIVTEWAEYSGCTVTNKEEFPNRAYLPGTTFNDNDLNCKTWCNEEQKTDGGVVVVVPPYAVDCAFDGGHEHPIYLTEVSFNFFRGHSTMVITINNANYADSGNAHDDTGSENDTYVNTASNKNNDASGEIFTISLSSSQEPISLDSNQSDESLENDTYVDTTLVDYAVNNADTASNTNNDASGEIFTVSLSSSQELISLDANQSDESLVKPEVTQQAEKKSKKEKKTKERETKGKKEKKNIRRIRRKLKY